MSLDDIDLVEINEAFASVVLAWQKETGADLGEGQRQRRRDRARPPARRDRRPADDDAAARARAHRRPLRPADDVRGRRPGQRHDHRTSGVATGTPRLVRASAPVRICDLGGWTDTWFAAPRRGVPPCREARRRGPRGEPAPGRPPGPRRARCRAVRRPVQLRPAPTTAGTPSPPRDRDRLEPHPGGAATSRSPCAAPSLAGSATGTSAAVVVALLGALDALTPGRLSPRPTSRPQAHRIETEGLGLQSGVQDQLASAHGGINLVVIDAYPNAQVARVPVSDDDRPSLEERTLLVYLGRPHRSSALHDDVIATLETAATPTGASSPSARRPDGCAAALASGDLEAYGRAMINNTESAVRAPPRPDRTSGAHR